jgi:hypothetical protein
MDKKGFRKFLETHKLSASEIKESIALAERFEGSLSGRPQPTAKDVRAFSLLMIKEGINTQANFYALARYGRFLQNNEVYVAVVDLLDGAEAMDSLYEKAGKVLGKQKRDEIFEGVELPPLGLPNDEKVQVTQAVMARLESLADPQECDEILSNSLRHLEDAWFQDEKQLYLDCQNLDEFLDKNAQNFMAQLERLKDEGQLFFTQEITDTVLEYVRSQPLIARGVREGDILYEVKIPHMTKEYLAETDERMKRYYYCHCPWVKEALKSGDARISPTFCNCSAGFHKKRWEVIFGQPLQAEIVESVLKGDKWCKIAIHLPEGV